MKDSTTSYLVEKERYWLGEDLRYSRLISALRILRGCNGLSDRSRIATDDRTVLSFLRRAVTNMRRLIVFGNSGTVATAADSGLYSGTGGAISSRWTATWLLSRTHERLPQPILLA